MQVEESSNEGEDGMRYVSQCVRHLRVLCCVGWLPLRESECVKKQLRSARGLTGLGFVGGIGVNGVGKAEREESEQNGE